MLLCTDWKDYQCLEAGNGEKIEKWGAYILRRPDPVAMWKDNFSINKLDAWYHRSPKGGGSWETFKSLPPFWVISYKDLKFKIIPTSFKHTGLFPEQASNWNYMMESIKKSNRKVRVLNLFAYTGAATIACAKAGAEEVVHVDASKGMIEWAKENQRLSHLENSHIRFLVDDCLKLIEREKRRGNHYDAIIMDPPSFGRGPSGEVWKLEQKLVPLIEKCMDLLSEHPLFVIINCYTTEISITTLENVMKTTLLKKYPNSKLFVDEIGLPIQNSQLILPCGLTGRWELEQ